MSRQPPRRSADLEIGERKRAEAALLESPSRTTAILGSIADAFYSLDAEWRFDMVNPAAERAPFGRPARELLGKVIWDVFPKIVGTRIHQHYLDAVAKRSLEHYEAPSPLNDRWYEVFMFPRTGGLDVYLRDIDDRKKAEEALRESEQRFRAIADNTPDHIQIQDSELRYRLVINPQLGFTEQDMIGKTDHDFLSREDADKLTAIKRQVLQTGEPVHVEVPLGSSAGEPQFFDGSYVPRRNAEGQVDGIIGYFKNVTQRKRTEEALRASEERFRLALKNAPVSVAAQDRDLRFLWAFNQRTVNSAEVIGKTDTDLFAPEDAARLMALKRLVMGTGSEVREQLWVTSNDKRVFLDLCLEPMRDASGTVTGIGIAMVDLTGMKQAEEALHAANLQLAEADQRKNQFLAVLSHELRNPLTPVRNSLYVLGRAVPGSQQAQRALAVITRQVGQLTRLVDDLLDITRVSRNKIQLRRGQHELNNLVRRTLEDHRSLLEEKGIVVVTTLAPERLSVNGDRERLVQVIGNLLQNAAKFTPTGGRVNISTAAVPERRRATLRVIDTGVGIEPAMLPRLFQPFMQADTTLDRSKGGLGLGLALVKGLVELHGGVVSAHSGGPGQGAEFMVELPLDETAVGVANPPAVTPEGSRRRVLIIEDNRDAADSLRQVLEFGAHMVEVAYNGPDGLAAARDFKPEIVLCDIGLPGMDGYAVARAFRADEALKGAYLVALSGYALPEDRQRAFEAGFARHLAKPPSVEALEQLLAEN